MYGTILVPLDGSGFGERALPVALGLATRAGAILELVRVAEPGASAPRPDRTGLVSDDPQERGMREAAAYLEKVAEAVRADADGMSPGTTVVPAGNVARSLAREAIEMSADLIVMSTHGHGALRRAWLGSTADALLRLAPCPILLVRPPETGEADGSSGHGDPAGQEHDPSPREIDPSPAPPFRHLIVPLDGSAAGEEVLPHAVALLAGEPGRISLIRVVADLPATASPYVRAPADAERERTRLREPARDYLETVADRLGSDANVEVDIQVEAATQPAAAILDFARDAGADGIALSSQGRGGVARLLLGSVADKVIRGSSVPVLVYRAPENDEG